MLKSMLHRAGRAAIVPAVLACGLMSQSASAVHATQNYTTNFTQINGQGASGTAMLTLNPGATSLFVQIMATGLQAGGPHLAHIHGLFSNGTSGSPVNSTTPTLAQDADGDGFIELAEGLLKYGPIIIDFGNIDPDQDGTINFSQTFNLLDSSIFTGGFGRTDLLGPGLSSLDLREIVIHGMNVAPGIGAGTPGEVNGTNGYLAILPVLSGEITEAVVAGAVPEPTSWALMILGFGAVGTTLRSRRRTSELASN
ncbi:PEPxxWA-CTERM sorting domain-containing protein [Sandarakinorhabdus sp.]|jgi:hypothetical protein|uniref:PEPxxWA-CTERM sorting domain-containing protein n=1 Tax=Sandarakinorhabdus sp. TaxID=1916663 RepID=UPI0035620642